MVDKVSSEIRSRMMAAVRGKNTLPEKTVRRALFAAGYRFRLHRRDLPGSPDVVLPAYHLAVFVHGCFWHGHECKKGRRPTSNVNFWNTKLEKNVARDRRDKAALRTAGWHVIVVWECALERGCARALRWLEAHRQDRRVPADSELTR
jgi:DNA mismatch endonuclease (patch repair protein)